MKPHKGTIRDWEIVSFDRSKYPDLLLLSDTAGFVVKGKPCGHPDFTGWIVTSPVVSFQEIPRHKLKERRIEIETLNSRYDLVGEGEGV